MYASTPPAMIAATARVRQLRFAFVAGRGPAAASLSPGPDASVRALAPPRDAARRGARARRRHHPALEAPAARCRAGRSAGSIAGAVLPSTCMDVTRAARGRARGASTASAAITFCSSRTLPGHACRQRLAMRIRPEHRALAGIGRAPGARTPAPAAGCPRRRSRSGGHADPHDGEPEQQVVAKRPARDRLGERTLRGRDHAHVDPARARSRRRAESRVPAARAAAWPARAARAR